MPSSSRWPGPRARFDLVNVDLGGKLIRNDWRVKLAAPGAQTELAGLFTADARVHLDNQYEINHAAPHGTSHQYFRVIGFGPSKAVLNVRVVVQPGAQKTDSDQRIANLMLAKGAEINAKPELENKDAGLFIADAMVNNVNKVEVNHAASKGTSNHDFRGIGFGASKAVVNGRVVVQPGAQKTDSDRRIANRMLAKGAEINAKPEREIYADDVKCAHGATCGQLDDTAVFYLRTRGVPEAQARALLTYSFINSVLEKIPHAGLRTRIALQITAQLGADLDLSAIGDAA